MPTSRLIFLLAALLAPIASAEGVDAEGGRPGPAEAAAPGSEGEEPEGDDQGGFGANVERLLLAFEDKETGGAAVEELVQLGDPRVEVILRRVMDRDIALWNGRPVLALDAPEDDREVLYPAYTPEGEDGPAGEPLATIDSKETDRYRAHPLVRRRAIKSALAVFGLYLKDPALRGQAAKNLGNRQVAEGLPRLRVLAEEDVDPRVRRLAVGSIAMIVAAGADPDAGAEDVVAAIEHLGEMRLLRARPLLEDLAADEELTAEAGRAIEDALAKIETHRTITAWSQHVFSGISLGSILVLIALGLAITFGLMGVINMAHGEMLMLGAVTAWACYEFLSPAVGDWYYGIAFPLSFLVAAAVGMLIEFGILRHLYRRPLDSLLATIGVSLILIQLVRAWKGDNLGMSAPEALGGGWEIYQDVILPYNRLFLIALATFCALAVVFIFRFTRFGLMLRATVQDRETARAMGVNTRLVDLSTFALGSGLAGLAGFGLVLLTNPTPEMGQTYIVKSFLVTVVGGVGKLLGVIFAGTGIGLSEKLLEPTVVMEEPIKIFDPAWAQVAVLLMVIVFMQRRPAGLFPDKGRLADRADGTAASRTGRPSLRHDLIAGGVFALVGVVLIPLLYGTGAMSIERLNLAGYICAFSICAIGLDLLWGYMGALSLCQFLFFALGGYAMGLYLINHGPHTADGIPECLGYVMSDVGDRHPPWFLPYFDSFPEMLILGVALPGLLALVIGLTTFRSRVRGVYFAILTQALTVVAVLVFEKNDIKLGGTNGLTAFDNILGYPLAGNDDLGPFAQTDFWLYVASFLTLALAAVGAKFLVRSGYGRVLVAIRDDETRLRFNGYRTWMFKTATFVLAAVLGAIGGMLYVPQKGIITPKEMLPITSIYVVVYVALGGRGTVWGAIVGTALVYLTKYFLTTWMPELWPFVFGALFIVVPLFIPGGLMGLVTALGAAIGPKRRGPEWPGGPPPEGSVVR